jgi:hypothetical protein
VQDSGALGMTMTWRTAGDWRRMRKAQEAAAALRRRLADVRASAGPVPAPGAVVLPSVDHSQIVVPGHPMSAAALTARGHGHAVHQPPP